MMMIIIIIITINITIKIIIEIVKITILCAGEFEYWLTLFGFVLRTMVTKENFYPPSNHAHR